MPRFPRTFLITLATLIGGFFCLSLPTLAAPQINNQINYQARLMDASGFPVADGNYSIIFSLYDAASAGTRLWTAKGSVAVPTALTVNVQNGLFTVLLGDTSAGGGTQNTLDTVDWNSDQIFLGVTIAADSEMLPRKRFASAPQAFNSRQLQGMYASSTASGGQTLFAINQTEATAATGTRSSLDVKTSGTSNANDFLIRGLDGTNTTVFSVNRQGNATTSFLNATNIFVSGLTTSTSLFANIATFATATVAGRGICLSDGSFCSSGAVTETDTLASVTNRGSFSTTTLSLFGGFTAASSSVTGTLTVAGNFIVTGNSTFGSTTATNLAATGLFTFVTATGVQITANSAIFNTATIANLFGTTGTINTLNFLNATGTTLNALTLSANTVTSTAVFVNGQAVCLANGTNCPLSGSGTDLNWTFNLAGDFVRNATATTDIAIGSSTIANAPFVFLNNTTTSRLIIGQNPLSGAGADVVIGATTSSDMKPEFQLDGNDLFVAGNIGSASSIYTNGSFVAGSSTTYYSENEIATNVPIFNINATSGSIIELSVSSTLVASFQYDNISLTPYEKPSGAGGTVSIAGGFGQLGTDQGGGNVFLNGGDADLSGVTGNSGGILSLNGGTGWGLGNNGGSISLVGGSGGNDASGGYLSFNAGSVFGTNGNGGDLYFNASAGAGSGSGGNVFFSSGDSFGGFNAGSVTYNLGSAYGGGDAGNFTLNAGFSFSSGQAGNIILNPGFSIGTGDAGHITLPSTFGFAPPDLRFVEAASNGTDFVGFRAPNSVTSSTIWMLPGTDGTAGQVISTDGLGNLSFTSGGGGGGSSDSNWTYNSASDFVRNATASTDIVLGSTATSTGAPVYFDLSGVSTGSSTVYFGYATKTNVIVGGTSTTASGLNPLFTMDGNDLLVTGMIGTDELYAAGRVDAPHLNRWFTNPLLTQTIYQGGSSTLAVADSPHGVLFDGSYIWVSTTDGLNPGHVLKIDPITNVVVATTTVGISPGAMAFDGTYLWVAHVNSVSPSISKINVNTNAVVDTISMPADFPLSIVFDGTYIWATSLGSFPAPGELAKIDPLTDTIIATSTPGSGTSGLAFDGYYLWTANLNDGTIVKIDRDSMQVVATTTLGGIPESVVFDGSYIWATNRVPSSVSKIDISTAAVVVTIPITSRPRYEVFDGKYIWVSNDFTGELYRIDPNTNSLAQTSNVGGAPRGVASDGSHIWAADSQGFVTKTPFQYGPSTNGYTMTIGYTSATNYGGLCVDDYGTGATCPTNPGASIVADGAIISNAFDLAEMYSVTGTYAAGDVLVLDGSSTSTVKRSTGIANDSAIVGVVSTDPGFVLGWNGGARVALAGQVPVKTSMNAGAIHVGDAIASADVAGYAMKATSPGMILGYALEDASATGTATLMINVGFWSGLAFGPSGSIQLDDSGNVSIMHDLHVGGKLFPSSKGGGIQNDWYLFVDDTDASSTYISTNASGFQSLDTYDFAERYYSPDELEPGDLVVVSDSGRTHVQRSWNVDAMLLGIVSTRPAFIAGRPATSTYPIALSGRVPTKVSNMNGTIKAGDPLSPTTIPGVAAKAIHSGPIIGLALEDYTNVGIEKIEVFVNPGYWVNKDETVAPAPAPSSTEPVSSPTVVSTNKQGFATITTGATKVHIEFPSLGAYPNVQVTPRGSTHGGWWTDNYTDTGFDILLSEAEFHDVIFTWRVEASTADDVMRMSDGTFGSIDPLTGIPILMAPTSTEPIPPPPMTETTSTEPIEIPPDSSVTST